MLEDQEGFLYPVVDKEKCVNCHLCEQVCPVLDKTADYFDSFAYAAKNRNEGERLNSSSGGLFIVLAKYFLLHGGIVFGAVFDSNFEVYHTYSSDLDGVKPMMRSKYVQSNMQSSYIDCENFLKQGKKVLFTGTPCQIDGLRHFLKKEYDNLLMVDVICHGVPSPGVWRRYLRENIFSKYKNSSNSDFAISFREKYNYGWKNYGFTVRQNNNLLYSVPVFDDPYMKGFLSNLYLRPSCHHCPSKGGRSGADLTIADFWGIESVMPDFDDDKGTGLLIVHSKKGKEILPMLNLDSHEVSLEKAIVCNSAYIQSVEAHPKRGTFFALFHKHALSIAQMVDKCLRLSFVERLKNKLISKFLCV
jgi:coenzyme F420-reducing hydrogenase beta subunit